MKYIKSILSLFLLVTLVSCGEDFLTRSPKAQFSTVALETESGVEGILIGAYGMVDGRGLDGANSWENDIHNWVFGGIPSDNALKGTDAGDQPEQSFIEGYDFNTQNGHIRNRWRGIYKGIARCNDAIVTANKVADFTPARKTQVIAEARFLRGLFHLEAAKMWREPLYLDDATYNIDDVQSTKQPNGGPIWDKIEADFQAAIADLPETQSLVGRPTKWAAKAFLAKTMMFQGWDDNGNAVAGKLTAAKSVLDDIVNNGPFELAPKFSENFLVATNNNSESIWEVQFAVSSAATAAGNEGIGLAHPYIAPWGCCGFYQAPQNLVNAYRTSEAGLPLLDNFNDEDVPVTAAVDGWDGPMDPRIDHTVGRPGVLYKDFYVYDTDFVRDLSYAGPYFSMKHVGEEAAFGIGGWGNITANNYRLMRHSMVLLWLAECEVEIGDLNRARELVNMIRARAANPEDFVPKTTRGTDRQDYSVVAGETAANYTISTYDDAWSDKDVARKAVRYETRIEFAMEGHRFFDLQRWGIAAEVLNAYLAAEGKTRVYLQGKTFTKGKNEYYPIPTEAIDRSFLNGAATITQDPAY